MRRISKTGLILLAVVAVLASLSPWAASPVSAQGPKVTVTNTPLPVSVTNSGANPIPVAGTISGQINVTNTPLPVSVANDRATPIPVTGTIGTATAYRFVGYSRGTATGFTDGIRGMNARCYNTYMPTSRMCTTYEYLHTSAAPLSSLPEPPEAWIGMHLLTVYITPGVESYQFPDVHWVDYSGTSALTDRGLNCSYWMSNSGTSTGLCIVSNGNIGLCACDITAPVACCDNR